MDKVAAAGFTIVRLTCSVTVRAFVTEIIGDGPLPDLGVQLLDLLLVDLRRLPAAALKHAGRSFPQRLLPAVDHRGMPPKRALS